MGELNFASVRALAEGLARGTFSAVELLEACLAQIERVNPALNAIVTLDAEGAYANARAVDERRAQGLPTSPLAGLPIVVKDTEPVRGLRTTMGSPILKDWVPEHDALTVQRYRLHGLSIVGKSNTPEFALGSQTFNPLFGPTRNPWAPALTCGGSSGGAAVALAAGMVPLADGSDMGGSLRNPASFCGVFGLRPTPGRVPVYPTLNQWNTLSVAGPMGRTAEDAAWLLSIQAGDDPRVALGRCGDPTVFRASLERDFSGVRVAWSPTLGGLPVEPAVRAALERALSRFTDLGMIVEEAEPELAIADEAFLTLRGVAVVGSLGGHYRTHRALLKDTAVWNVEQGLALTGAQVAAAVQQQSQCFERMRRFLERYDYFICPAVQCLPFPVETPYPTTIDGVAMETYLDWMRSASRITLTSHPAASAAVGFSDSGLPVGMQIVGPYGCEHEVLQLAHAVELPLAERIAPGVC